MNILYIQHGLGYGGATKSLILTQKAIHKYVNIYTLTLPVKKRNRSIFNELCYSKEIAQFQIPSVYSYAYETISESKFNEIQHFEPNEVINFILSRRIDIVHINSSVFSNILKHIKQNTKAKIVIHIREMLPYGNNHIIDNYIISNTIKYADFIIAISNNETKYFPSSDKIKVIPNPHDFSQTDPYLKTKDKSIGPIIIGMCSGFLPYKGHLDFIEMARRINQHSEIDSRNVEFRIIGYPHKELSFRSLIRKSRNQSFKHTFDEKVKESGVSNLRITPYTFDIYEELSEFDIYIRPDLTGHPWGRDIIEAMALSKPVIATGSSEFYVKHKHTGYLTEVKNPEGLFNYASKLINNLENRDEFGMSGYRKIKRMCDIENYTIQLKQIYDYILLQK